MYYYVTCIIYVISLYIPLNKKNVNTPLNHIHTDYVYFLFLGGGNMVAIDLIVQHVHSQLEEVRLNASQIVNHCSNLDSLFPHQVH